jgi:hypothetical protein
MSQERAEPRLVVVAHPGEEVLLFSTVCAGADVVAVQEEGGPGWSAERMESFHAACVALGARSSRVVSLSQVREGLGAYARVYTHSPHEAPAHHRAVCLAVSRGADPLWVPALGARPLELRALEEAAFHRKLELLNTLYGAEPGCSAGSGLSLGEKLPGVEAFTCASQGDVVRTLSLTDAEIYAELPDPWSFTTSPYELERYELTSRLLGGLASQGPEPERVLEVGACEGLMTQRLLRLFPRAVVQAVEPDSRFTARLSALLGGEPRVQVVEASVLELPLEADLVLLAEVLYYLPGGQLHGLLGRISARWLLTSYGGTFDEEVQATLRGYGWRQVVAGSLRPRLEPVDGASSPLWIRRSGTQVRLWSREFPLS